MKDLLKPQKEQIHSVTRKMLDEHKTSLGYEWKYASGAPVMEGDTIFYGLLVNTDPEMIQKIIESKVDPSVKEELDKRPPEIDAKMISFKENEIGELYEFIDESLHRPDQQIPYLRRI